ncbi:PREDICTED: uncharacterized protein LOC109169142 [Ipomoea nil]|uniref:uncharacterized protein LOC109169142 n=1 Tax=Ipomoea nil TaxID=35883 RepID=UPI00090119F6|nr:PREDICTED: uncharacterized protein LOC109169142 [Ipomoea nil]
MAAWPSIGTRTTPSDNAAGGPAVGTPAPVPATSSTTLPNISNVTEVSLDSQSQSNPYFMHASENPALELVSTPLEGPNYHPWARAVTMALSCKNKLAFVDGTITKPSRDDRRYPYWERCNNMVVTWLIRSLSPTIGRSVLWIDTAYGVWRDLKKIFSQQDLFRVAEIKCEIYRSKHGDNSLNEYFTQQKLLWDELQILRPPAFCGCISRCECGKKIDMLNEQMEKDKLSIFLIGLHDRYTCAKNRIMLMKPLPEVSEAYSMIAQQERQLHINSTGYGSPLFQTGENNAAGSVLMTRAHTGSQQNYKKFSGGNKKAICTFYGFTGHTENKYDFKKFLEFVHIQKSNEKGLMDSTPLDQSTYNAHANTISANQMEGTNSLSKSISYSKNTWILDSGATHHIVCCMELLSNPKEVHNMFVRLPNGQQVAISCIGRVCLSDEFILQNVLYIPGFCYNLISVGAFIQTSRCTMKLHTNQCVIQDAMHGKMIGLAELQNGLYLLTFPVSCFSVHNTFGVHTEFPPFMDINIFLLSWMIIVGQCGYIYLMKKKSEARDLIVNFCNMVENQFQTHVKNIRSDNGKEFDMIEFYKQKGIQH